MPKLSELIAQGKEIRLTNSRKNKNIMMKRTKDGWITQKYDEGNKANRGPSGSVLLKEDPKRYIKKLYASQYRIFYPEGVELD
jgi:hypothetical protein